MDIKRPLLIAALAIVSYTMVFQWNKDYGQAELPTTKTQTSVLPGDTPNVPTDVPADAKAAAPVDNATAKPSTALIKVRTDVLDLAIDPRGGDIVQLGLVQYPQRQDHPDVPFTLFDNDNGHLYLAQSGLTGTDGPDANSAGRPLYSSPQSSYVLADGQQQLVVDLKYQAGGVDYIKRFTFHRGLKTDCTAVEKAQKKIACINPDAYEIQVSYLIDNKSEKPWQGVLYAQIKRDGSKDPSSTTATGVSTYLGAAVGTPSEPYRKVSMSDMDKHRLQENVEGGWVGWLQHYFVTAWVPNKDQQHQIYTRKDSQGNYIIGFTGPQLNVPPGGETQTSLTLYAGPKIQAYLKMLSPGLELTVDYGFLWFIAQPIFWLLQHIHNILGNWGWSIIVLTIIIKMLFFPLSAASYRSMARMRAVGPRLQALKEQHGDDRQKMSQAMMELYRKEKINPLGGCLPIVVQMPVFLALYWVLLESVEMRQSPWIFWITDLSAKDPYFILPIIMGGTMLVQQMLNPAPPDPMQARVMKMMPIVFTFFFLWFPAGLVLYWIVNNCLSILQQWYITRKIEAANKKA